MADQAGTQMADRVSEALSILRALDVPQKQQNERSALTLLALLDMTPEKAWADATNPCYGITQMMKHFAQHFGKSYAPNTRETIRRSTIHQFVLMGLVLANPDKPDRPVNSPDTCYQITPALLELVRQYGTPSWGASLANFVTSTAALRRLQPAERVMSLIPVTLPDGRRLDLTAGGQNELVRKIVEEFCPRFTPGGILVYVGDTGRKQRHIETEYLTKLGVVLDEHGKMPDVIVHLPEKNWLVLIEAVTSHGPINIKRQSELRELFKGVAAGLVFVTAFLTRRAMAKHLSEIAWETEAWVAEVPDHIIHFNGERFLGPRK